MSDVIWKMHKLRKLRENEERLELLRAEEARAASERALACTQGSIQASHDDTVESASVLAFHHAHRLRLEMQRRRCAADVDQRTRVADHRRDLVVAAATDARVVELVGEARDARRDAEALDQARRALDEAGLQSWLRRTA